METSFGAAIAGKLNVIYYSLPFPLSRDGWLLFATCAVRSFAYGFLSVILGLYLDSLGLGPGGHRLDFYRRTRRRRGDDRHHHLSR